MKLVIVHPKALETIRGLSRETRRELGEALLKLQHGLHLGLPLSRPMPEVLHGVHELRLRDENGIYRVFYFLKSSQGILVFHAFKKKTQKTPAEEISTGRRHLKELFNDG